MLLALSVVLSTGGATTLAASDDPEMAACEAALLADLDDWNGCACAYRLAGRPELRTAARELLASVDERFADRGCAAFYLGSLAFEDGDDPRPAFVRAAERWSLRGDWTGAYYARMSLARWHRGRAEFDRALTQMELGIAAAAAAGEEALADSTELEAATLALERGEDLAALEARLVALARRVATDPPDRLELDTLDLLAQVRFRLGDLDAARAAFDRLADRRRRAQDRYGEATARYHATLTWLQEHPSDAVRARALTGLEQALVLAEEAGNQRIAAAALHKLGRLTPGASGRALLDRSVAIARRLGETQTLYSGLLAAAEARAATDPAGARALALEAAALVPDSETPSFLAEGWLHRLRITWRLDPPGTGAADLARSLAILEEIERLRMRQEGAGAEFFSLWLPAHQWLAGRLYGRAAGIDDDEPRAHPADATRPVRFEIHDPPALHQGFAITERMRAKILRRALNTGDELPLPGLDDLQALLAPDEALLSWQLSLWENAYGRFEGGSWLVAVEPDAVRLYALPDAAHVGPAVDHFTGLFEARDGGEARAAAILERQLLAPALADLGDGVEHLILVPDGPLAVLPFAALRGDDDGPRPLSGRFRLSTAPSAALWAHWRRPPRTTVLRSPRPIARVFADPPSASFPPLPGARREARGIRRRLGTAADLLVGTAATEAAVRSLGAGEQTVLHLATHALVDERRGQPSGIVLAGGDGLLDLDEIAALDLGGTTVVLAACRSGGGRILYGEGPLSLARAVFAAGSDTVVASLWPLRDDEAAALFEPFYDRLAEGSDVATALAAAQRHRADEGAPAAAWAGVVVLGDGAGVPFPGGVARPLPWTTWGPRGWLELLGGLGVLTLGTLAVAVRRRSRPGQRKMPPA